MPKLAADCRRFFSSEDIRLTLERPFLPGCGLYACLALAGAHDIPDLERICLDAFYSNAPSLAEQAFDEGLVLRVERRLSRVSPAADQVVQALKRQVTAVAFTE